MVSEELNEEQLKEKELKELKEKKLKIEELKKAKRIKSEEIKNAKKHYEEKLELYEETRDYFSRIINKLNKISEDHGVKIIYTTSRIKCLESYLKKAETKSSFNEIKDIIGFRVICLTEDDVYAFRNFIINNNNGNLFSIDEEKDYIKEPKDSGYRSYHVILNVPMQTLCDSIVVPVEVQVRTIFMDVFAREEHKLCYKSNYNLTNAEKCQLSNLAGQLSMVESTLKLVSKNIMVSRKTEQEKVKRSHKEAFETVRFLFESSHSYIEGDLKALITSYPYKSDIAYQLDRIKPINSICRKLESRGLEVTSNNIVNSISDVVGFKIVCIDEAEVLNLVNYFKESNVFDIVEEKDYITNPKQSGYRGYHIKVRKKIPVLDGYISTVSEIQIKTMLMDGWSTYEDSVYGKNVAKDQRDMFATLSFNLQVLSETLHNLKYRAIEREKNETNKGIKSNSDPKILELVKKDDDEANN